LQMLGLTAEDLILDVGSGPGSTAVLIAEGTGAQVSGIDLSPEMVAKARNRVGRMGLSERVDFRVGNVLALDFEDDRFDAVIFESLLTILPGDPGAALAEMVRVVKPGGLVAGNEATIDPGFLPELESLLEQHPAIQRAYTAKSLQKQFESAGLADIKIQEKKESQAPQLDLKGALQEIGCGGLLTFFLTAYPKLVWKLITDPRLRQAQQVDEQITKLSKQYMGYALIVGRKPIASREG
jgi:SAM-dependent methyltransferase